jgi:predicted amidophosphoribosyltransferase
MGMGAGFMLPAMMGSPMFQAAAQGSSQEPVCPDCKNPVSREARFCPACGHQLLVFTQCPSCGKNLPPSARFCSSCGLEQNKKPQARRCSQCGAENLADSVFCNRCGEKIE